MNRALLPPAVAALVAAVIGVTRRIVPLILESPFELPSTRVVSLYAIGGRFVSFLFVYGLLLGVAYWVGRSREGARDDATVTAETGAVAAVSYLVVSAATLLWLGPQQGAITAILAVGSSVGVGVQLAVVAFAGLSLGRLRSPDDAASA